MLRIVCQNRVVPEDTKLDWGGSSLSGRGQSEIATAGSKETQLDSIAILWRNCILWILEGGRAGQLIPHHPAESDTANHETMRPPTNDPGPSWNVWSESNLELIESVNVMQKNVAAPKAALLQEQHIGGGSTGEAPLQTVYGSTRAQAFARRKDEQSKATTAYQIVRSVITIMSGMANQVTPLSPTACARPHTANQ